MSRQSRELTKLEQQRNEIAELRELNSGLRRTQMTGAAAGIANELLEAAKGWAETGDIPAEPGGPFPDLEGALYDGFRAGACQAALQVLGQKTVEEQLAVVDKATDDETRRRIAVAAFSNLAYRQPEALLAALPAEDRNELLKSIVADPRALDGVRRLVRQHEMRETTAGKIQKAYDENGYISTYYLPVGTRVLLDAEVTRKKSVERVVLQSVVIRPASSALNHYTYMQPLNYDKHPFKKPFWLGRIIETDYDEDFEAYFMPGMRTDTAYELQSDDDEPYDFGTDDDRYISKVHRFVIDGYDIELDNDERFGGGPAPDAAQQKALE